MNKRYPFDFIPPEIKVNPKEIEEINKTRRFIV